MKKYLSKDHVHPSASVILNNGIKEFYPIDNEGVERKWLFERNTVEDIMSELSVVTKRDGTQVPFDKNKVISAVNKAPVRSDELLPILGEESIYEFTY